MADREVDGQHVFSLLFPESPAGEGFPFSCPGGLGEWTSMGTLWLSASPRRDLGVNGKTNVFLTFFPKIAFPWSVALKSLGVSSAPRSPKKHRKPRILNGLERFWGTLFW